jgi:hypothetical protein
MRNTLVASYALGVLAFAGICAVCAVGGLKSALAAPPRLLYVSDPVASLVEVFSLPDLVLKATLTGFSKPHGSCSDKSGNVWVTNTGTRQILEYAHGGTSPIAAFSDPYGDPFGCAVDDHHNKVGVTNIRDVSPSPSPSPASGPGEFLYLGSGTWSTSYDLAALNSDISVGIDPLGNAYIDGLTSSKHFVLAELPAGSTVIHQITITGGTLHYPGMVQWYEDGHYLAVGDRRCDTPRTTCVYHISISGSTGTIIGKTKFKAHNGHVICDMAQGAIGASGEKFLAGGDDESACGYAKSSVDRWAFPAGGSPTNSNHATLTHPFGTAISK